MVFGLGLAIVVAVILIGRAGDDDSGSSSSGSEDLSDVTVKPKVEPPEGELPTTLVQEDIVEGTGAPVKSGDQLTVQYVGIDAESGEQFDASWDNGMPFDFQLGAGEVIPGWDQGVAGMKAGGRRKLVIPPDLAYGEQGQPPSIAPNATLVFIIDVVESKPAANAGKPKAK